MNNTYDLTNFLKVKSNINLSKEENFLTFSSLLCEIFKKEHSYEEVNTLIIKLLELMTKDIKNQSISFSSQDNEELTSLLLDGSEAYIKYLKENTLNSLMISLSKIITIIDKLYKNNLREILKMNE